MVNFRVSVKSFIVDKNDRLLVLKRVSDEIQKPNIWEIPGGRLEFGEDPIEGMKREAKEETGLDVEVLRPLSVRHFTRVDGQIITMLIFLCRAKYGSIILSEEHTDYDWMYLDGDTSKLTPFYNQEVEIYRKDFLK